MITQGIKTIIDGTHYFLEVEPDCCIIQREGENFQSIEKNKVTNSYKEVLMAKYHALNFIVAAYPNDEFISLFTNDSVIAKELGFKMMFGPMEYYLELSPSELEEIYWQREKSSFPFPYPEGLPDREVIYKTKK